MFNYFFNLYRTVETKVGGTYYELIDLLLNKKQLQHPEQYLEEITASNVSVVLGLIKLQMNTNNLTLLEIINQKFPEDNSIMTLYGLHLLEANQLERAEEQFNKVLEKESDPAVFFYLISLYLKKGELEKANKLIMNAERDFKGQKQVIEKIAIMKQRLSSVF